MELYAGIDLHSSNNYIGIMDQDFRRVHGRRLPNKLGSILKMLEPFRADLKGVVVESTYNWYWLADGLQEHGYVVHLANPSAIKQYEGIKQTDDRWDSFWLAQMKHLNILPEGYIYPKEERPIRDMLRRRLFFVKHRTANILSLQSMVSRNLGIRISVNDIKRLKPDDAGDLFDSPNLAFMAQNNISTIKHLTTVIKGIEKKIKPRVQLRKEFEMLTTIPGIGTILGLTIMLEVGDINRFPKVGNYSSYCRCVRSQRLSNGRKKGENNTKNGNRYLAWAYVEAAHFAMRYMPKAQKFYQKKMAKSNGAVATKALANKLARASYFVMRGREPFDESRVFK